MVKDVMERDMINEISTLFVMIFTSGMMFVMPILDIGYNDHNRIRDTTIFYINHNPDLAFLRYKG